MAKNLWTREELILVFNLYLKLPFGRMHTRTPEIIEMANLTGRTVNSIAIRLVNFAACDPYHKDRGVKGMVGGIKQCQPIWDEFSENKELLIFESENILAEKENQTIENKFNELLFDLKEMKGESKIREVKTRINQNVFRQIVVANYSSKCAITGIDLPELLFASHIVPWAKNEKERLNPENGICLSALYDKAFDKGFITITPDYKIKVSKYFDDFKKDEAVPDFFLKYENQSIILPDRFLPSKEFLEWHYTNLFKK